MALLWSSHAFAEQNVEAPGSSTGEADSLNTRSGEAPGAAEGPPATFQEPPASNSSAAARASGIDEIIVTAQKRATDLQETPISIGTLTGDALEEYGIKTLKDLQYQIPGVTTTDGINNAVSIRGVGNQQTGNLNAESSAAMHIDGVYQPRVSSPVGFSDVERIEVLRGPQGTLYGRNNTAGTINFILRRPTEELTGQVKLGYGSFKRFDSNGFVSGPLIKGLLNGHLFGEILEDNGYIEDLVRSRNINARTARGARAALSAFPANGLSFDLSVLYREDDGIAPANVLITPPDPALEARTGIFPPTTANPNDYVVGEDYKVKNSFKNIGWQHTLHGSVTGTWDLGPIWKLGSVTLKSITGLQGHSLYTFDDSDAMARNFLDVPGIKIKSKMVSEELNTSISNEWVDWLIGGYYFHEDYFIHLPLNIPVIGAGQGLFITIWDREPIDSLAAFTDVTFNLTNSIRLFGGVRVSRDNKDMSQTILDYVGHPGEQLTPVPDADGTAADQCIDNKINQRFDDVSPRIGLQWSALDDVMLYFQRAKGYKSGGANFSFCNNPYKPETVVSYEGGIKSRWLGGNLTNNLSIFHYDYTDFQIPAQRDLRYPVINAEAASMLGGELETVAQPLDRLTFNLNVSLLDAQYDKFADTDNTNPDAGRQDLSGKQMNRAPHYTVGVGGQYAWPIPIEALGSLRIHADWFRTDDIVHRPFGNKNDRQEAYSLLNAFISVTSSSEALELRLLARNLTKTYYHTTKEAFQWGNRYGTVGEPRFIGTELIFQF